MATDSSNFNPPRTGETSVARRYNRGLHLFALLTVVATFPLIFIGGLVTSHGAGLAVPDWPNSYGYNMFLFPPSQWVGNIWYEHVHRLYASGIGLLCIVLCVWAWRTEPRKSVRRLAYALLGLVIFQGVLGGLRVVLLNLDLAIVHGCTAQAFFCLAAMMALVTSRWWVNTPTLAESADAERGRRLMKFAYVAVAIVFGQLILGAVMRHYKAGLAIPDFPLSYGHVLPPADRMSLEKALDATMPLTAKSVVDTGTGAPAPVGPLLFVPGPFTPYTLVQIWLHFSHRIGALIVSITLLTLITKVLRIRHRNTCVLAFGWGLLLLLLAQLTLGILTVLLRKPADIASAHVAVGALVLMTTFLLSTMLSRLYRPRVGEVITEQRAFEPVFSDVPVTSSNSEPFTAFPATRATS